jgi:hypothetical protein
MSRIVIVILIYYSHKPTDSINLLGSWRRRNVFHVRYGKTYRAELSFNQKTGRWIMSRIVVVTLWYNVTNLHFLSKLSTIHPRCLGNRPTIAVEALEIYFVIGRSWLQILAWRHFVLNSVRLCFARSCQIYAKRAPHVPVLVLPN